MPSPAKTVVFDFDHTLTSWDSAGRFFKWLLKRNLWRMGLVALALPLLAPLLLFRRSYWIPIRYAVWVATLGLSADRLQVLVREHVGEISAQGSSLILEDAAQQLRWHCEQGHVVVIATGSLEILAREFLLRSDLGHVPLVGSSLKPFLGGAVSAEHCFGKHKIVMLSRRGFPPPWSVAYTDHHCDLPVLELSGERFLVNPKPEVVQILARRLVPGAQILAWR